MSRWICCGGDGALLSVAARFLLDQHVQRVKFEGSEGFMKAAWYERQELAREVLTVGDMPDPSPGPGEVRIRIGASGINPGDIRKRQDDFGYGMPYPRVIPHSDGAGQVDQVGDGVSSPWLGKPVWCYGAQSYRPFGTAADFTVVPAAQAVPLPANVTVERSACARHSQHHSASRRARGWACQRTHGTYTRSCWVRGPMRGPTGAPRRSSCHWDNRRRYDGGGANCLDFTGQERTRFFSTPMPGLPRPRMARRS